MYAKRFKHQRSEEKIRQIHKKAHARVTYTCFIVYPVLHKVYASWIKHFKYGEDHISALRAW